jgi:hypothetical protein
MRAGIRLPGHSIRPDISWISEAGLGDQVGCMATRQDESDPQMNC